MPQWYTETLESFFLLPSLSLLLPTQPANSRAFIPLLQPTVLLINPTVEEQKLENVRNHLCTNG